MVDFTDSNTSPETPKLKIEFIKKNQFFLQKQPQTFERVENNQNGIDYSQYESGDDENLIFYNNQQRPGGALGNYSYLPIL